VEKIPTRQLYTIGQLRNRLNKCKVDLAGCKSKVDYQKRQLELSITELGTDWEDSRGYYKTVLKVNHCFWTTMTTLIIRNGKNFGIFLALTRKNGRFNLKEKAYPLTA